MKIPDFLLALFSNPTKSEEKPPDPIPPLPPRMPAAARRISLVEELRGNLSKECYAHGFAIARKSGRRTPEPPVLKALEALAEAKALSITKAQSDVMAENLLRRLKEVETMREQRILDRDLAANKYDAALQALADTPKPGAYPEMPTLFVHTTTGWLAISLTPTCHDLLVGADPQMKWLAGFAIAFAISTAMVYGMLPASQPDLGAPSKTAIRRHGTMIAGLLLGLSFLGLRLSAARTYAELLFASALALIELGAVVQVERKAKPLFAEIEAWRERMNVRRLADAHVAAAKQELDRRQDLVGQADQAIEEIEDALERAHAGADGKTLISIAVSAIRAGYIDGISGNAAALGGAA